MPEIHLLSGGTLLPDWSGAACVEDGAVAWSGGTILAAGARGELERLYPEAVRLDARAGWIAPGLVNAHHHIYSALATGLDPGLPIDGFGQRLDRLWWRLDRALDEASIRQSARLTALRCALAGCTTLVDHHASPACVDGSLDWLAEELEVAGLSALLCYEATDRNGHAGALAGLRESRRFRDSVRRHERFRGLIGLHAAFTLGDDTLAAAAQLAEDGDVHVHVAEDRLDGEICRGRDGLSPLERLDSAGLLGAAAWIAHGTHLDEAGLDLLARRGALLVHNPESNANNQVGRLDLRAVRRAGVDVALGTDGMSSCLLSALRCAFLLHRQGAGDPAGGWQDCAGLLDGARARLARLFGQPAYGQLVAGAPADLIVLDVPAALPPTAANLTAQLVFGQVPPRVRHTVARGRRLVDNFEACGLDPHRLAAEIRPVREALWRRFHQLGAGTPYLGAEPGAAGGRPE
ncbi:MAG: amidohydrolase family protein [Candidatus Delongbacteria bacterium]